MHPQRNVFKPNQDRVVTLYMQDAYATTRGGACGGTLNLPNQMTGRGSISKGCRGDRVCVIFGNLYMNASMAQDCTDLLDLNQSSSQSGNECVARETLKTYSQTRMSCAMKLIPPLLILTFGKD